MDTLDHREEQFYDLVEFVVNDIYEKDESHVVTEDDEAVTMAVMEYFKENYREPTMEETCAMISSGKEVNEDLYLEIVEALLMDESIGSFVAGAVHGVSNVLAKHKDKKAFKATNSALSKTLAANKAHKEHEASGGSGLMHKIKGSFLKAKASSASNKFTAARKKSNDTFTNMAAKRQKSAGLASKIDSKVKATKEKIKTSATNAAHKVASTAGKVAGAM